MLVMRLTCLVLTLVQQVEDAVNSSVVVEVVLWVIPVRHVVAELLVQKPNKGAATKMLHRNRF
jgi:hypothetical protein